MDDTDTNENVGAKVRLTQEDIQSLLYFWEQYQDLTKHVHWNELSLLLEKQCPELLVAWKDYVTSEAILTATINSLQDEIPRDE